MNILTTILFFMLLFVIILVAYSLCKKFIFDKVSVNKWIPLAIAIIFFAIQLLIGSTNQIVSSVLSIFTVILFLWFWDIVKIGGAKKKEKQIKIKPKAKPNRVKKK
jgi:hypothetical protein